MCYHIHKSSRIALHRGWHKPSELNPIAHHHLCFKSNNYYYWWKFFLFFYFPFYLVTGHCCWVNIRSIVSGILACQQTGCRQCKWKMKQYDCQLWHAFQISVYIRLRWWSKPKTMGGKKLKGKWLVVDCTKFRFILFYSHVNSS